MSDLPRKNPYIKLDNAEYWKWRPDWYKAAHRADWYESIDVNAIAEASNDDVADVVHKLISYARVRDKVIEHRQKAAFHVGFMLRFVLASHERTVYTVEQLMGILKMLREYLIQIQVVGATDTPDAPEPPRKVGE